MARCSLHRSYRRACLGLAGLGLLLGLPLAGLAKPVVAITSPADQAVVTGETWINVAFRSDSRRPIVRLELQLDGKDLQDYVVPAPLLEGQKSFPLDMSAMQPGAHRLSVRALDSVGEAGAVEITLNGQGQGPGGGGAPDVDRIPPVISIYYPAQGAVVAGSVTIRAEATDNVRLRSVLFYVDGKLHTIRMNAPPYNADWDTTAASEGPHVLEARAKDSSDNEGSSAPVTVIVQNKGEAVRPAPAPAPAFSGPAPSWGPARAPVVPSTPIIIGPSVPGPTVVSPPVIASPPTPTPGSLAPYVASSAPTVVVPTPPKPKPPQPVIASAAGPGGEAPQPVISGGSRLLSPPSFSTEAPVPAPGSAKPTIPGTDLSAWRATEPQLAMPTVAAPALRTNAGGLQESASHPSLDVPAGGTVARPKVEPVAAPSLAVPPASVKPPQTPAAAIQETGAPIVPATPSGGTVSTPRVEKLPEPELAVPTGTSTPPTAPIPATAPGGLEGPAKPPASGAIPASGAVAKPKVEKVPEPEVAVPHVVPPPPAAAKPGRAALARAEASPPGGMPAAPAVVTPPTALPSPTTAPMTAPARASTDKRSSGELASWSQELYHEGPVTALPGATIGPVPSAAPATDKPAAPVQPAVVAPAVVVEKPVEKPLAESPKPVEKLTEAPAVVEKPAAPPVEKTPETPPVASPTPPTALPEPPASAEKPSLAPAEKSPAELLSPVASPVTPSISEKPTTSAPGPAAAAERPPRKLRAGLRHAGKPETSAPAPAPAPSAATTSTPPPPPAPATGQARKLTPGDAAQLPGAQVLFEGKALPDEARPEVRDGVLMVSLKPIFEAADGAVYWFSQDQVARAVSAGADVTVHIGATRATLNGESRELPAAPVTKDGRLLVPLDLVAEALQVTFQFDPSSRQVLITH